MKSFKTEFLNKNTREFLDYVVEANSKKAAIELAKQNARQQGHAPSEFSITAYQVRSAA